MKLSENAVELARRHNKVVFRDGDRVIESHRLHDHEEGVVPVFRLAQDIEHEIDFGSCFQDHLTGLLSKAPISPYNFLDYIFYHIFLLFNRKIIKSLFSCFLAL